VSTECTYQKIGACTRDGIISTDPVKFDKYCQLVGYHLVMLLLSTPLFLLFLPVCLPVSSITQETMYELLVKFWNDDPDPVTLVNFLYLVNH